ncbi:uncharacterized protein LOC143788815 [Ranitomeya variabilis]|uniref:uncharacterized protein LOC143788814 n=1 Tax=Ranitomeya variabilis TaxID=490064 RepID=UPI004055A7B9
MGGPLPQTSKTQISPYPRRELPLRGLLTCRGFLCRIRQRDWWGSNIWTSFFRTKHTPTRRSRKKRRGSSHDAQISGRSPNSVVNISNYTLSPLELKVLNMGLSFCPTPKWDSFQLERDLQRFYRSIRLKVHFEESTNPLRPVSTPAQTERPTITIEQLGLRNRSTFIPPKSNHAVETFVNLLDRDVKKTLHEQRLGFLPVRHNLDPLEKQALDSLSENKNIIIKPADKGGAIVVMDKSFYVGEVRRQLSDTTTYKILQTDPTYSIQRKIKGVLDKHLLLNTIDNKTKAYLTNNHPVTPVIYILPKIHKNLQNPPGRPIVASTDSILNPLSMFLEKLLTPYTKLTKSFILDTGDFLKKIRNINNIPCASILCTFDVNSLYTSITHDKGIEAVSLTLNEANVDKGSQELCTDLLNLVLRENFFLFEDDFFVQICGTAMGSNVAPAYANLYMDRFEKEHVYPDPAFQKHARTWYRYIDDIFCIWQGDLTSLLEFYATINAVRSELSFTLIHHSNEVTFLDTKVLKDVNGYLSTDIYTKPTDCNSLLLYNSCHPKSIKNSLPRSQFKRVTRIVSDPPTRETRIWEMTQKFEARNYPSNLLQMESARATSDPDNGAVSVQKNPRLPFVHNHHPTMHKIHNLIRGHWPLLIKAYPNISIFRDPPLMCTRRPRNIRDKVVRADLGSHKPPLTRTLTDQRRTGTFPCLSCMSCSNIIKGNEVIHPRTGKSYPIKDYYTCATSFVVYIIKCPCGLLYVGETTQAIRDRISSHKSTIRREKLWLPLPAHFKEARHNIAQLRFQIVEKVPRPRRGGNHIQLLKQRETFWIYTLDTLHPRGLNREIDWLT